MEFVIQKINNEIRHDFSFTLIESIRFQNWLQRGRSEIKVRYLNTEANDADEIQPFIFRRYHGSSVPIGSVEFVIQFLEYFHGLTPKPRNVPESLFFFGNRRILNGTEKDVNRPIGRTFIKSNDKIKGFQTVRFKTIDNVEPKIPPGNYQISDYITIDSEWRVFVYNGKMVGLQHYVGEFTVFPSVLRIKLMIDAFKDAPIAYTLDVGVNDNDNETFVIEVHDFFSCGLYGFSDHSKLPFMYNRWFHEYILKNKKI